MKKSKPLFADDELIFPTVDKDWGREQLLSQDGLFFLKDVAHILNLSNQTVKVRVKRLLKEGKSPYQTIGIKKLWGHWLLRMKIFAPFYRAELQPKYQPVRHQWDGNDLLRQKGLYRLADVCKKIPFSATQLRAKARQASSKENFGLFKDKDTSVYLVDMEPFSVWVQQLWLNDFRDDPETENPTST